MTTLTIISLLVWSLVCIAIGILVGRTNRKKADKLAKQIKKVQNKIRKKVKWQVEK